TGVMVQVPLNVGASGVRLDVSDGWATTSTAIVVTVVTAAQATNNLAGQLNAAGIPSGIKSTLLSDLNGAAASFNRGSFKTGVNQMQQFVADVSAQTGKKIDTATANSLI